MNFFFKVCNVILHYMGFLGASIVKNPPANAGATGSVPGSGRFPGGGNGIPFQYSCLDGQESLVGYSPGVIKS